MSQEGHRYFTEDPDGYYDIKDPVCDLVFSGATEWAGRTDWSLGLQMFKL